MLSLGYISLRWKIISIKGKWDKKCLIRSKTIKRPLSIRPQKNTQVQSKAIIQGLNAPYVLCF